ncbi:MAG: pyrimidine 5'-nucleotidase [Pseudomonadota bacterium]
MTSAAFDHVRYWVFDLDNTLYPPSARLFEQMHGKMRDYVAALLGVSDAEADAIRKRYWLENGTTLAGLIHHHAIDPWQFLRAVHDIDLSGLEPDTDLAAQIRALPGRRIVYTNGDAEYAGRVLAARGLEAVFDAVYGIEHADWAPKPNRDAFDRVFAADALDPEQAAMFEDEPRNLVVPHALGMRTIHVAPAAAEGSHIHHHTSDLAGFLAAIP